MKELSPGMRKKAEYLAAGYKVPICIHIGCNSKVKVTDWKTLDFRSECQTCIKYRNEGRVRPGRTFVKKDYCENRDGHLGFPCPVNLSDWGPFFNCLDLDHKDGNHANNVPENIETLCKLCHGRKSMEEGDNDSTRESCRSIDNLL